MRLVRNERTERQRAVDVAVPVDAAADELVRMLAHQPGFTFTVADLLPPVGACRGAVPVPHERRRRETRRSSPAPESASTRPRRRRRAGTPG